MHQRSLGTILGDITVLAREMFSSRCLPRLINARSNRGFPIGSPESGILSFWGPRFGILKKYGRGIQDCIYGRDAGFNVIMKRDPRNRHFEAPRSGEKFKINSTFAFGNDGNDRKFKLSILDHADTCLL